MVVASERTAFLTFPNFLTGVVDGPSSVRGISGLVTLNPF